MSIHVNWDNPNRTILRYTFTDPWNWLQMRRKVRLGFALSRTVGYSLGILLDLSDSHQIPAQPVAHVSGLLPYLPPNWETIVVISPETATAQVFAPIYKAYRAEGMRLLVVQTDAQAQMLLQHEHHMKMQGCRIE